MKGNENEEKEEKSYFNCEEPTGAPTTLETKKFSQVERLETTDELKKIELLPRELKKIISIGAHLEPSKEQVSMQFLSQNIFTWAAKELPNILQELVIH